MEWIKADTNINKIKRDTNRSKRNRQWIKIPFLVSSSTIQVFPEQFFSFFLSSFPTYLLYSWKESTCSRQHWSTWVFSCFQRAWLGQSIYPTSASMLWLSPVQRNPHQGCTLLPPWPLCDLFNSFPPSLYPPISACLPLPRLYLGWSI